MCGATHEQKDLQRVQADFFHEGIKQQRQVFGQDQEILKVMKGAYEPILLAGPNQHGFNDEERQTYNTQILEGTAQNYSHAAEALGENVAAMGGGDDYLPTGTSGVLKGNLVAAAAREQSAEQLQVKQADYAKGYDMWKTAGQGLATTSGQLAPTAYSGAATSAGGAAGTTANQIAEAANSPWNAAMGAIGAVGGAATSAYIGKH
jgi:hypothetical protein